ncbi:hypothetical protein P154DRAFT_346501 [Amniculicola lignicola CBS 123094]|uniref:Uncharacterized protein n=1 Tax=Amniculicola lignicola CBS 123094 TaxID=1392246 RepID=A0A6A5WCI5_9PLEO|nr:hypothetical protein P154DRAFT_346501 [Amniculicola lignicola CBS 123094]
MANTPVSYALLLVSIAQSASAHLNGQYETYFPDYKTVKALIRDNCTEEWNMVQEDKSRGGYGVTKCILENMGEMDKAELAITAVILGLLPMALQMIGPRVEEIARLGMQRPLLAWLMSIGSPCATLDHQKPEFDMFESKPEGKFGDGDGDEPLWPSFLDRHPGTGKVVISLLEYFLVIVSAGNAVLLGYQLSFWTVSLVSTMLGTFGNTAEAFSPLLWMFLSLPISIMGMLVLSLSKDRNKKADDSMDGLSSRSSLRFLGGIAHELQPCAYQPFLDLQDKVNVKPATSRDLTRRYLILALSWAIKIFIWVQVLYGIFIFSSTMYVTLWTSLGLVSRFMGGSLACRLVLEFELYGAGYISKRKRH